MNLYTLYISCIPVKASNFWNRSLSRWTISIGWHKAAILVNVTMSLKRIVTLSCFSEMKITSKGNGCIEATLLAVPVRLKSILTSGFFVSHERQKHQIWHVYTLLLCAFQRTPCWERRELDRSAYTEIAVYESHPFSPGFPIQATEVRELQIRAVVE